MSETKVNDAGFIENLGKSIEDKAVTKLTEALSKVRESQDLFDGAASGGGATAAVAVFLSIEYTEQSWDTKIEDARTINQHAQQTAKEWRENQEASTPQ